MCQKNGCCKIDCVHNYIAGREMLLQDCIKCRYKHYYLRKLVEYYSRMNFKSGISFSEMRFLKSASNPDIVIVKYETYS